MRPSIELLALGIDKRLGDEEPTPVLRVSWTTDDLPIRAYFHEVIEEAYASNELP